MERLLQDLASQASVPPILVIDSSDDGLTRDIVLSAARRVPVEIRYAHTGAGLTRQRMEAVNRLAPDTEVVHFVDDDVILEPNYFAAIEETFVADRSLLGAGGLIANLPEHRPSLLRRLFLLDCRQDGKILPSGINVLVFSAAQPLPVDWLSGCSMSYRRSVFDRLSFDTRMTGYSLGEDVDFSYRVAKIGHLMVTPHARLAHLCSPVGRTDAHAQARAAVVRRHQFVRQMRGDLRLSAFWWSFVGELVIQVSKGLLGARRYPLVRAAHIALALGDIAMADRGELDQT